MTTLIFGKNSQVGKELLNFTVNSEIDCTFYNSKDLNFNNNDQIQYVLNKIKPDIIVNLAAFTDVDASEENYGDALIINAQAPGLIASISKDINASFINAPLLQDQQMIDVRCPLPVDDAISMCINLE